MLLSNVQAKCDQARKGGLRVYGDLVLDRSSLQCRYDENVIFVQKKIVDMKTFSTGNENDERKCGARKMSNMSRDGG